MELDKDSEFYTEEQEKDLYEKIRDVIGKIIKLKEYQNSPDFDEQKFEEYRQTLKEMINDKSLWADCVAYAQSVDEVPGLFNDLIEIFPGNIDDIDFFEAVIVLLAENFESNKEFFLSKKTCWGNIKKNLINLAASNYELAEIIFAHSAFSGLVNIKINNINKIGSGLFPTIGFKDFNLCVGVLRSPAKSKLSPEILLMLSKISQFNEIIKSDVELSEKIKNYKKQKIKIDEIFISTSQDWENLPPEIMTKIIKRLSPADFYFVANQACNDWNKLGQDLFLQADAWLQTTAYLASAKSIARIINNDKILQGNSGDFDYANALGSNINFILKNNIFEFLQFQLDTLVETKKLLAECEKKLSSLREEFPRFVITANKYPGLAKKNTITNMPHIRFINRKRFHEKYKTYDRDVFWGKKGTHKKTHLFFSWSDSLSVKEKIVYIDMIRFYSLEKKLSNKINNARKVINFIMMTPVLLNEMCIQERRFPFEFLSHVFNLYDEEIFVRLISERAVIDKTGIELGNILYFYCAYLSLDSEREFAYIHDEMIETVFKDLVDSDFFNERISHCFQYAIRCCEENIRFAKVFYSSTQLSKHFKVGKWFDCLDGYVREAHLQVVLQSDLKSKFTAIHLVNIVETYPEIMKLILSDSELKNKFEEKHFNKLLSMPDVKDFILEDSELCAKFKKNSSYFSNDDFARYPEEDFLILPDDLEEQEEGEQEEENNVSVITLK